MLIDTKDLNSLTGVDYYDGSLIHQRFAYKFLKDDVSPTGDIISFISYAKVETSGMIDLQDVLDKDFIYSKKMIHFVWEIPTIRDGVGAVAFQRLFNTNIAFVLASKFLSGGNVYVDGDDLKVKSADGQVGKASVSITYCNNGVAIGHTGINIDAGEEAPSFAFSTNLSDEQAKEFIKEVEDIFYFMTKDMFIASTKVQIPTT